MFVPDKITLFLDKATLIAVLGFVIAACACVMIKNALEKCIHGNSHDAYARFKGFIALAVGCFFLGAGIYIILENQEFLVFLTEHYKHVLNSIINTSNYLLAYIV